MTQPTGDPSNKIMKKHTFQPTHQNVYMDPFTDYGFKKLFGEEDSKIYLIDFLNSVLTGFLPEISELTYSKNEHLGNKAIDRNAVFDLYCKSPKGERFIIELQKVKQDYFKQRSLFYSTFAIQEQAKKGAWDFNLAPVYCIGILNFSLNDTLNHPLNTPQKYITKAKILDIESHQAVIEELNFAFIECSKFDKTLNEHSSKQDKWLYVLSHLANLNGMPSDLSEPLFEAFFQKANVLKLAFKERALYNASLSYSRDLHNIEAQNYAKGKEEGMAEGEKKGEARGKKEAAIQMVRALKAQGVETNIIMAATGLTADEINQI
jgi:predicted transposase/invertase (TIGR01784 family)